MLHAEDRKYRGEKRGISRQPDIGRRNPVATQSVNAILQPILGDIPIDKGVRGDGRKTKNEQQSKRERRQGRKQKEPEMLPHDLAHVSNISRFGPSRRISALNSEKVTSRASDFLCVPCG